MNNFTVPFLSVQLVKSLCHGETHRWVHISVKADRLGDRNVCSMAESRWSIRLMCMCIKEVVYR